MSFKSLGLPESILDSLEAQKFGKPFPIQEKAIPAILEGKDILGIAKTGSGKTASYTLPILTLLQKHNLSEKDRNAVVLIVVPTRELAVQVGDVFNLFSLGLKNPVRTISVFGGVSINPQMKSMYGVNVLIATPGRLLELVDSKAVHLGKVKTLILDEADKMLNLGFKDEMNRILGLLPKKRQNLLFSATLSDDVNAINQLILDEPLVIKIEENEDNLDLIEQVGYFVSDEKKGPLLRHLIKENEFKQVLVFTSSTYKADNVAEKLRKHGIDAQAIHSKRSQGARTEGLRRFKAGQLPVIVATDLLARGIDIEFLPCVVNYELPRSPKDFVHRIGRTGRAENPGKAITFVSEEDKHHFRVIQKKMKKWVVMIDTENIDF